MLFRSTMQFRASVFSLTTAAAIATLTGCTGDISDSVDAVEIGSEKALTADGSETVDVDNPYGGVFVVGESSRDEYLIRPTAAAGADTADLDGVVVTAKIDGSKLKVTVVGPSELSSLVDIEVLSPASQAFAIVAGDDDIVIDGLEGVGAIDSDSGAITISGFVGGDLAINTDTGSVNIGFDETANANVAVNTESGDIDVSLPSDADLTLAATSSGDVNVSASGFDGQAFGGVAAGDFGAGSGNVALTSSTGDISVSN